MPLSLSPFSVCTLTSSHLCASAHTLLPAWNASPEPAESSPSSTIQFKWTSKPFQTLFLPAIPRVSPLRFWASATAWPFASSSAYFCFCQLVCKLPKGKDFVCFCSPHPVPAVRWLNDHKIKIYVIWHFFFIQWSWCSLSPLRRTETTLIGVWCQFLVPRIFVPAEWEPKIEASWECTNSSQRL